MADYTNLPNKEFSVRELFGIDTDMKVKGYAEADSHVPPMDPDYLFDRNTVVERRLLAAYPVNLASPCRLAPQRHLARIEQCELDAGRTAIESQDEVAC